MAREEPAGAPICWGKQFDEDDDECKNCNYNISCRPATINNQSTRRTVPQNGQSPQFHLPMVPPQPPQPMTFAARYGYNSAQQMPGPMLPQSGYPRTPMPPQQVTQAQTGFQPHAPAGWNTPIAYLPRPNPSNPAWWQYQGETTGARLGKNMLLGALQALFSELLRFLAHWTWPAVPVRT